MSNPFLGQIIQGGWNFAPRGYNLCDGSLLSIAQNSALFALLGTSFGGDGRTTFGLPDLRGRVMVGTGQGPGLSLYTLGEMTGTENATLTINNMPSHTHGATFSSSSTFNASTTKATTQVAASGSVLGRADDGATNPTSRPEIYCPSGTSATIPLGGLNVAGTVTVQPTGGNLPFSILQPLQAVTVVIALQGIFPSRN